MTKVEQAEHIIMNQVRTYGTESVAFMRSVGRVLAEDIVADRDMPPFNRVTMDGIAIPYNAYSGGTRSFIIAGTQAAGEQPLTVKDPRQCIEIMTGAVLPDGLDTVVRYEDILITGNSAEVVVENIHKGQNIHFKGRDRQQNDVVASKGRLITPALISLLASVGQTDVRVNKFPRVVIISSGDELVEVSEKPQLYQIRRSNTYTVKSVLQDRGLQPDMLHILDDPTVTEETIIKSLKNYDVILLSGGVSMGKFDYVPKALQQAGVNKLFHKVQQRPGKPFWFGASEKGVLVFAFPGNPVATFMCLHRYFLPWLNASAGIPAPREMYAALAEDYSFEPDLEYFLQVKTAFDKQARLFAVPLAGNGSGDFANLADTDAFLELPAERTDFKAGEVFRLWPFNSL